MGGGVKLKGHGNLKENKGKGVYYRRHKGQGRMNSKDRGARKR